MHIFRQILAALSCFSQGICVGSVYGMSSILLAQLKESQEIILDLDEESWIASIPTLAMIPAVLTSGPCLEKLGRRSSLRLVHILTATSWIVTHFANSFRTLLIGRIMGGMFLGQSFPMMLTYLGEVTSPSARSISLAGVTLGCTVGVLLTQLMGFFFSWRTICLVTFAIPVCNLIVFLYLRESYIWYMIRGEEIEARRAFAWFRGHSLRANEEIEAALAKDENETNLGWMGTLRFCLSKKVLMPYLITIVLYVTLESSGDVMVIFYTSQIIKMLTNDLTVEYYSTIALNSLRVLASATSCILLKRFSVRKIWIASGHCLVAGLLSLSLCLFLAKLYPGTKVFAFACILLVTGNVTLFALGFAALPNIICGELYPAQVRGLGSGMSVFVYCVVVFSVVKGAPFLFENVALSLIFLGFGLSTFTGVTISWFILPDTKDRTLKQLELEAFYERKEEELKTF